MLLSIAFNIGFAFYVNFTNSQIPWIFPELGPAVMQDAYHDRAPALESPFGQIGDIPGGYSLYGGNPLQSGAYDDFVDWFENSGILSRASLTLDMTALVLAVSILIIPIAILLVLGRRSYGSSKTH
jgi:hypothetical protein